LVNCQEGLQVSERHNQRLADDTLEWQIAGMAVWGGTVAKWGVFLALGMKPLKTDTVAQNRTM